MQLVNGQANDASQKFRKRHKALMVGVRSCQKVCDMLQRMEFGEGGSKTQRMATSNLGRGVAVGSGRRIAQDG